eukprot:gene4320-7676_t
MSYHELDLSNTSKGQLKYSRQMSSLKTTNQNSIFGHDFASPFPTNFSNPYHRQPFAEKKKKQNKFVLPSDSESESEDELTETIKPDLEVQNVSKLKIQTQILNDFEAHRKLSVKQKIEEKRKQLENQLKERYSKSEGKYNEILRKSIEEKEQKMEIFSKLHQKVEEKHHEEITEFQNEQQKIIDEFNEKERIKREKEEKKKRIQKEQEEQLKKQEEIKRKEKEEKLKKESLKKQQEQEEALKRQKEQEEALKKQQEQKKPENFPKIEQETKQEEEEEEEEDSNKIQTTLKLDEIDTSLISQNAYVESEIRLKSYHTIEKIIKSDKFIKNLEYKQMGKKIKGRINTLISQLSTSKIEVEKKTKEIGELIKESTKIEEVYYFVLISIAKLIVNQGKAQVYIQPRSAFSYSNLALRLCKMYPALTEILLAQFHISCCFTIPKYVSKQNPNYFKEMGFDEREDSKTGYESTENYLDKMNGVIMLYAALIQTPTPRFEHPHGIDYGWTWLSRILNMKPNEFTCTILYSFLDICGYALNARFTNQFKKVIKLIKEKFIPILPKETRDSSLELMKKFINDFERGILKEHENRFLDNSSGQSGGTNL